MRNQSKMTKYICELREHGIMHLSSLVRMFSCRGLHLMLTRSMVIRVGPWRKGYGLYRKEISGDIALLKNLVCIRCLP